MASMEAIIQWDSGKEERLDVLLELLIENMGSSPDGTSNTLIGALVCNKRSIIVLNDTRLTYRVGGMYTYKVI